MKSYFAIFPLLMTLVVSGAQAQALPSVSELPSGQPSNLSVRKSAPVTDPALLTPGNQAKADGQTSHGSASSDDADNNFYMRYGSGYESRKQGESAGDNSSRSDGKSGKGDKGDSDGDSGKSSGKSEGKGGGKGKGKGGGKGH